MNLSITGKRGKIEISKENLMNTISLIWFRPYTIRMHHLNSIQKSNSKSGKKSKRKNWLFIINYKVWYYKMLWFCCF